MYNEYEKDFISRCMTHMDKVTKYKKHHPDYVRANELFYGLSILVVPTIIEDIQPFLIAPPEDDRAIIVQANKICSADDNGYSVMTGGSPEYYKTDECEDNTDRLRRMEAITAIWLTKYIRSTKKSPYKNVDAYFKKLLYLQWCLLRMYFYRYGEVRRDAPSKRVEAMLMEKYGLAWFDARNFQEERPQVFLDILHMYSFEYYPPYSQGILGQRGEYLK